MARYRRVGSFGGQIFWRRCSSLARQRRAHFEGCVPKETFQGRCGNDIRRNPEKTGCGDATPGRAEGMGKRKARTGLYLGTTQNHPRQEVSRRRSWTEKKSPYGLGARYLLAGRDNWEGLAAAWEFKSQNFWGRVLRKKVAQSGCDRIRTVRLSVRVEAYCFPCSSRAIFCKCVNTLGISPVRNFEVYDGSD
jgi:hypothetical protein